MISENAKYFLKNHKDQIESADYTALIRDAADLSSNLAKEVIDILKEAGINYKGIRDYILDRKELAEAIQKLLIDADVTNGPFGEEYPRAKHLSGYSFIKIFDQGGIQVLRIYEDGAANKFTLETDFNDGNGSHTKNNLQFSNLEQFRDYVEEFGAQPWYSIYDGLVELDRRIK